MTYAIQVFGVQLMVGSTLSILFVPKFYLIFYQVDAAQKLTDEATPAKGVPAIKTHSGSHENSTKHDSGSDRTHKPSARGAGDSRPSPAFKGRVAPLTVKAAVNSAAGVHTPTSSSTASHLAVQGDMLTAASGTEKRQSLTVASPLSGRPSSRLFAAHNAGAAEAQLPGQMPDTSGDGVERITAGERESMVLISPAAVEGLDVAGMTAAALTATSAALQAAMAKYEEAMKAVTGELARKKDGGAGRVGMGAGVRPAGMAAVAQIAALATRDSGDLPEDSAEGSAEGTAREEASTARVGEPLLAQGTADSVE